MADPLCKRVTLSGSDQLEVVFTNDCVSGSYDRDLFVDWVTVDGLVVQAEGGAAIIDRGSGDAAFDGLEVIAGQQALTVNGALRFVVGQQAYAACYDGSGNMTWRLKNGTAYEQVWDAENRLVAVKQSGVEVASYTYDGDGTRVKATVEGGTTAYLGSHLEWTGSASTMKVYYYAGGERVAMRVGSSTVYWFLGDHLGSTAMTVASSGIKVAELRYKAWGETRYSDETTPTMYRFTGQRLDGHISLYQIGARWYDYQLGRWLSPDTIIPDSTNPQSLNRFSYVYNRPLVYIDSGGHFAVPVIIAVVMAVAKVVDYGWTAWDAAQSARTLADPCVSRSEKLLAGFNLALAVGLEAIEPDDLLPIGLPVDDFAREASSTEPEKPWKREAKQGWKGSSGRIWVSMPMTRSSILTRYSKGVRRQATSRPSRQSGWGI